MENTSNWESDFWSCLAKGDGIHCPLYATCEFRKRQGWCWDDYRDLKYQLLDQTKIDELVHSLPKRDHGDTYSRLSLPLELLVNKFILESNLHEPPVPTGLIHRLDSDHKLEIHHLPLKTIHGAAWFLEDRWVVQLNKKDTRQMKRFTLFHEGFHILARSKLGFKSKFSVPSRGRFIEGMADMFATGMLVPTKWAKGLWQKTRDVGTMAAMFDVPFSVMWFRLRHLGLI